jgi:regulator of nucleoside diphosphate kinase
MKRRAIYITDFDMKRLRKLLERTKIQNEKDRSYLESLEEELDRAKVVASKDVPPNVVTMNSEVRVTDLDTGDEITWRLVFPGDADYQQGRISILAPVGTAIIGFREGDTVEWNVPSGMRRLRIKKVVYQPEAAGDYHL